MEKILFVIKTDLEKLKVQYNHTNHSLAAAYNLSEKEVGKILNEKWKPSFDDLDSLLNKLGYELKVTLEPRKP